MLALNECGFRSVSGCHVFRVAMSTVCRVTMDVLECRQNQAIYGFHGYQVAMVTITLFVSGVTTWLSTVTIESDEGQAR